MDEVRAQPPGADAIPRRNPDYLYRDGFLVNIHVANDAVYVNDTARVVWGLCDGKTRVAEISASLESAYPENRDEVRDDVLTALELLTTNNIVFIA